MSVVAALKSQLDQQQVAQASILQQLSVIQQQQPSPATPESSTNSLPPLPPVPSSDAPPDTQVPLSSDPIKQVQSVLSLVASPGPISAHIQYQECGSSLHY